MGVGEQGGIGTGFTQQSADKTGEAPIGIAKDQTVRRFSGEQRIKRLIAPRTPIELGEGPSRYGHVAAQSPRRLHRLTDLPLGRMTRVQQCVDRLRVKYQPHLARPERAGLIRLATK